MSHVVKADPKAIAARRGVGVSVARDPQEVARKKRQQEQARQAAVWRKQHVINGDKDAFYL